MSASASDVINLAASVISILGGGASLIGFLRKLTQPAAPPRGYPPASASSAGYPQHGYLPQQPPHGYPPQQPYPSQAQAYPPAIGRQPIYASVATMVRARRILHPVIFGCAALALLCVVIYSLTLLYQYVQTGSTNIATDNPLIVVTVATVTLNLLAGSVAVIGMIITTARARAWGWFTFAVVGLGAMLFTVGIFSVVALVPACFYALYDAPRIVRR